MTVSGANKRLFDAILKGDNVAVAASLKAGANPNKANAAGVTPLFFAIENDKLDIVKILLKAGAKPEKICPIGKRYKKKTRRCVKDVLVKMAPCPPGKIRNSLSSYTSLY